MGLHRYKRRFTAWIACVALLLASLAPTISHALATQNKAGFLTSTEICSINGVKSQKAESKPLRNSAPVDNGLHFEHCPFCFTHAGFFGPPPSGETVVPLVTGSPVRPALFSHSPDPLFAWVSAQPRAPPVVS
jgi:hypothetical protein